MENTKETEAGEKTKTDTVPPVGSVEREQEELRKIRETIESQRVRNH